MQLTASPDHVVRHEPAACRGCGNGLAGAEQTGMERRQVTEIPEVKAAVTEHQMIERVCPCCGERTKAQARAGVTAPVQYGPRAAAVTTYLWHGQFLSRDRARAALRDMFGCAPSPGAIAAMARKIAGFISPAIDAIVKALLASEVVHFDETGFRVTGGLAWVHSASSGKHVLVTVHDKRATEGMNAAGMDHRGRAAGHQRAGDGRPLRNPSGHRAEPGSGHCVAAARCACGGGQGAATHRPVGGCRTMGQHVKLRDPATCDDGIELTRVGGVGDEGIDGIGLAPISAVLSSRVAVQAKRYDPTATVGREIVALFQRDATAAGAERAVLVTLARFPPAARKAATVTTPTVDLIDGDKLCDLVRDQHIGLRIVTQFDKDWFDRFDA